MLNIEWIGWDCQLNFRPSGKFRAIASKFLLFCHPRQRAGIQTIKTFRRAILDFPGEPFYSTFVLYY